MANMLESNIIVSKFKHHLHYKIYLENNDVV